MKSIKKYIMIILLLFYFLFLFINNLNFNNIENLENIENIEDIKNIENIEDIKNIEEAKKKINGREDLHLKSREELNTIIYDLDNDLLMCRKDGLDKTRKKIALQKNNNFLRKKINKLELELLSKNKTSINKTNNNLKIPNLKDNTNNDKKNEIQNTGIIKPRWGYYKDTNEPAMWNGYSDPNIIEYNN